MNSPINPVTGLGQYDATTHVQPTHHADKDVSPVANRKQGQKRKGHQDEEQQQEQDDVELTLSQDDLVPEEQTPQQRKLLQQADSVKESPHIDLKG